MGSWRDIARPIIAKVILEHHGKPTLKQVLYDAYPFGERQHFPYKIWLDEIKRQLGTKGKADRAFLERSGQQRLGL